MRPPFHRQWCIRNPQDLARRPERSLPIGREPRLPPADAHPLTLLAALVGERRPRGQGNFRSLADHLDRVEHRAERAGRRIELTSKEFSLLEYLMRNAGRQVSRAMIIEHVWNLTFDSTTNVVDVYINYLRRKVDDGHPRKLIHTVRGVGYELSGNAGVPA